MGDCEPVLNGHQHSTSNGNGHLHSTSNGNGHLHSMSNGNGSSDASPNTSPAHESQAEFPIAIVGMSCRFAGSATSPSKLWELCAAGKDSWSPIPEERFSVNGWYDDDPQKAGRTHVKSGYFLSEDIALFDAPFFKITGDQANALDPQMRLLLEGVYEAAEDAGIPIENLAGSNTSVFTGCFSKDYYELQTRDPELIKDTIYGNGTALLSNRISYLYNFRGPSMSIDTGCSASLVALHQACRSIWSGDSDVSVAAGTNAILNQDMFITMASLGALSKDGRCFAWDSRANGYGRGEGVGVLLLKPLSVALQDGDRVHSVIRAIGVNHDGKTPSLSSPSMDAQIKLIQDTYRRAGLDIRETGYVESHMTGTPVGDPIEAEALARTFGQSRQIDDPILVGSVKTNIGHTESVSGIAAVIKTCFALREGLIPPNLNYNVPHKSIPLKQWHMQVPTTLTPWPKDKCFRASINNFGYGGANAHLILERQPVVTPQMSTNGHTNGGLGENGNKNGTSSSDRSFVYILSAKDSSVAKRMANKFAVHIRQSIKKGQSISLGDLAYTLGERRSLLTWVVAVPARNLTELCDRWESPAIKAVNSATRPARRLGFVFNGQGAQWYAMARELIHAYPVFSRHIYEASRILNDYGAEWSLYDELMRDERSTRINEADISQWSSVAVQLCLVNLLKSWGITPSAVTSHSSGEIAAAYTVGALSFKEALGVIYYRGKLVSKVKKLGSLQGGMAAVGLGVEGVKKYITDITTGGHVLVACINSHDSVTISGDSNALDEVLTRMEKDGVFARKLKVPLAYHSRHMLQIAEEYSQCLQAILPDTGKSWDGILFSSPVTGKVVTSAEGLPPSHWARNLTNPVLFSLAFENMCFSPSNPHVDMIVEIGAHSTLAGPIRQILKTRGVEIPYISCLKRPVDAVKTMQDLVCELLGRGYPVSLNSVNFPQSKGHTSTFVPDLPTYPWKHETRYWDEPRLSRELRNKNSLPHELLGTRVTGATSKTHTWRNFFSRSEIEWLKDHRVESKIVLPGAAYISMAIEAVRLLTDISEETIRGYRLRDVEILKALLIPESSYVEIQLSLRQCNEKELEHDGWYEFELCSLDASGFWAENCKGYISAEIGNAVRAATTRELVPPSANSYLAFKNDSQVRTIDKISLFDRLHKMGIQHGPAFQNLTDSRAKDGKGITNFVIADSASANCDYVLHPSTLDSIFQTTFCCLPESGAGDEMSLPRSIRAMFIPKSLKRQSGDSLQAFTERVSHNQRGLTSNVYVINTDDDNSEGSFFQMQDLFCQTVPRDHDDENSEIARICSKSCWELDISYRVPASVKESMRVPTEDNDFEEERKLARASIYLIHDAICELEAEASSASNWVWHHKLFYEWMKSIVALADSGELRAGSKTWSKATKGIRQRLYDELNAGNSTDRLLARVGQKLAAIIRGEVTTLELMVEGNLLGQYYSEAAAFTRQGKRAEALAELYAMNCPGANILEIGAGTGTWTKPMLEAFSARGKKEGFGGSLLGHYTYTDISQGFFAAAREKFAAWEGMMDFKPLDIEEKPTAQGFEAATYDLVVAAMVLHATKNLSRTLSNVRKLLKPGGRLFLFECTKDRLDTQVVFGPLPGWWLSEEPDRKMSPNVSLKRWDQLLQEAGFSGIDFDIYDYDEADLQCSCTILSTAIHTEIMRTPIAIVHDTTQTPPQPWLSQLCDQIQLKMGAVPSIESLDQVQAKDKVCIFTAEIEHPFLDSIDGPSFEKLRGLVMNSRGVLWLSSGGLIDAAQPSFGATQGLLRTLRFEDASKRYVHLDFERALVGGHPWTSDKIDHIVHVLQRSFSDGSDESGIEYEYAVKNSELRVARLIPEKVQSQICNNEVDDSTTELQPFLQPGRPLVWETSRSGLLSDLHFTDKPDLSGNVPSGFVEIEAKAFGMNFRDLLVALQQLDEDLIIHEFSGIITQIGPDTEDSGLKIGDRVCGIANGRYASTARAHWTSVVKISNSMSYEWAATIPVAYATAYHSLFNIARVQKGESVLVHAAAGGFGQAAVVLAQYAGAEVFATCSSETKRDLLAEQYNIPLDHILSSRDVSFAPAIMTLTNGKGVDVVLNSLSGALLKATWDCISRFGRFIEVGKIDIEAARRLDLTPFRRCATFASIDLMQLKEYNRLLVHKALVECVRICHEQGKTPIFPIRQYSISNVEEALRLMQTGKHIGKLILVLSVEDKVKVISRLRPVSLDNANATYLIVGGVTGIGCAVAEWMISRGAKNLLLVSRHATTHPNGPKLQLQGDANGCNVHIRDCDLSDENSLVELLAEYSRILPPIRGVVNGAMVLDDTIFEHMTHEQWTNAIRPKINVSRNLHQHLPKDLFFFIMLSSALGIGGGISQANYAAGNTYQDALARHRTREGLPAVTIDLCAIRKVGYVENRVKGGDDSVIARVNKLGVSEVDITAVLNLLEAAIRDPFRANAEDSQVVMGITEHTIKSSVKNSNLARDRRFSALQLANRHTCGLATNSSASNTSSAAALVSALSAASTTLQEASNLLIEALSTKLAEMFNIASSEIDVGLPLLQYGVDSLVAVELRNWLSSTIKAKVSVFEIIQSASLVEFSNLLARKSEYMLARINVT